MHSDMDTKDKLNIINEMLPKGERLIASVGGHIIPPRENDFIYNAFSTMVTQEWGNSNQPLGVHSNLVKNVYMGLTENNVYVAVLNTYHPDIVQAKLTVPQSEISWDYAKRGFRNIITVRFNGTPYEVIVPSRQEMTHLKDQRSEAEKFMDYVLEKTRENNLLWERLHPSRP